MCFRRCQRGAAPRWRGHGHLSLVTGPASRVASLWARRHRFQGSLHTGHPLATLSGPTGRALRAASGPLLRRQLPARWPAGGGQAAGPAGPGGTAPRTLAGSGVEAGLSPLGWGVAALACRPRLTCGAAMCVRPAFCTSAQRLGWVTRDHKLFHHMEARPAKASNLFTHTARALAPPSASANEVGLGGGCGLAVLLICLRHQGGGGGILFLGFLDGIPVQIQLSIIT